MPDDLLEDSIEREKCVEVHTLGGASRRVQLADGSTVLSLKQKLAGRRSFREFAISVLGEECWEDCRAVRFVISMLPPSFRLEDSFSCMHHSCAFFPSVLYMRLVLGLEVQPDAEAVTGRAYQLTWDLEGLSADLGSADPARVLAALRTVHELGPTAAAATQPSHASLFRHPCAHLRMLGVRLLTRHMEMGSAAARASVCTWIRGFSCFRSHFGEDCSEEDCVPVDDDGISSRRIDWIWEGLVSAASALLASTTEEPDDASEFLDLVRSAMECWLAGPWDYDEDVGVVMVRALPRFAERGSPSALTAVCWCLSQTRKPFLRKEARLAWPRLADGDDEAAASALVSFSDSELWRLAGFEDHEWEVIARFAMLLERGDHVASELILTTMSGTRLPPGHGLHHLGRASSDLTDASAEASEARHGRSAARSFLDLVHLLASAAPDQKALLLDELSRSVSRGCLTAVAPAASCLEDGAKHA